MKHFFSTLVLVLATVTLTMAQSYPDGMVSYWKFDTGSGNVAVDVVDSNPGTIHGATWTAGIVGQALQYDGIDDYVRVSPNSTILLGTTDFTLEAWIKTTDLYGNIFFHYMSEGYILAVNDGRLQGRVRGGPPGDLHLYSNQLVNDGEWHHVVFMRFYNQKRVLYIDGEWENENVEHEGDISINIPLEFGRDTWHPRKSSQLNGIIDEAAIYNRTLTEDEIYQHYINGLDGLGYEVEADTDNDGVPDRDDLCADTNLPDDVATHGLKPNHWMVGEDGFTFVTVKKGKGQGAGRSFTLETTGGCTCEQIITAMDLGKGHIKHGCSNSAMDAWVALLDAGKRINVIQPLESADSVPETFVLENNYPNPFNPLTTIRFGIPEPSYVTLVVYDALGRQVEVLVDGLISAGKHEVRFEAGDLPSGVYLYRLVTPNQSISNSMLLMK